MQYKELDRKYTPLIKKIIKRYPAYHREDLEQEARIALYQASLNWFPERGASFMTFAYRYITSACYKYMRDKAEPIRVPAKQFSDGVRVPCASLETKTTDNLTLESMLGSCELDVEETGVWDSLIHLMNYNVISKIEFALLYYRYQYGYTHQKLADSFGLERHNASNRVERSIKKVRPYFFGLKRL